jgi:acetate kinase
VIEAMVTRWPGLPQVACFDTAFHRRMPEHAQRLPLPASIFDAGVRRYGFHGLSYEYVVQTLGDETRGRVVVAHLGHGSSLSALLDGRPMYTTMGFTPTGGVMMSTRSGDLDPGVLLHLLDARGWEPARISSLVNEEAGLLGVSGRSADMRSLLEVRAQDARADQAITMYCGAVRRAIGALAAELGGLDLLIFTGGIGEHAPSVRDEICRGLGHLGVGRTASAEHRARVRVVPTNENLMIARHTWQTVFGGKQSPESRIGVRPR